MADQINLSDNLSDYRTKYNALATEFNVVSSITKVTADSGSINIGSGQVNKSIDILGGSNINTSVVGSAVQVDVINTPTFVDLTVTGTANLNGTTNVASAIIIALKAGGYDFPGSVGLLGEALVVDGSGNLVFGLGGTGATIFKALTDTPAVYTTLGGAIPFFDGTIGGVATNIVTDSTFTYDSTNDILVVGNVVTNTITMASTITTGDAINIVANSVTTGNVVDISSSAPNTSTRNLLKIENTDPLATGTTCIRVDQNNPTGIALGVYSIAVPSFIVFGNGLVEHNAGIKYFNVAKVTTYAPTEYDHIILCDASSGSFSINLPAVAISSKLVYEIKHISSGGNTVTVDGNAGETIDGATTQALTVGKSIRIICDGSEWHILSNLN